jgi:hypothetical protein
LIPNPDAITTKLDLCNDKQIHNNPPHTSVFFPFSISLLWVCVSHVVFRSSSGLDPARFDNLRFGVRAKRVQFAPAYSAASQKTRRDETRRERQIAHLPQLERSGEEEDTKNKRKSWRLNHKQKNGNKNTKRRRRRRRRED